MITPIQWTSMMYHENAKSPNNGWLWGFQVNLEVFVPATANWDFEAKWKGPMSYPILVEV